MEKVCIDGTYKHDFVEKQITISTCKVPGVKSCTCRKCGYAFPVELPLKEHNYVNGVCTFCGSKIEKQ